MRDVILAAAGEVAETAAMAARDQATPVETGNDIAIQLGEARSTGVMDGARQGSISERERIKSILMSESAKGRENLAQYFAFETDFPTDVVLSALAKSPAAKGGLDEVMLREAQPKLGAGDDRADMPVRLISTEDIYARRRAAVSRASHT
jgi:hypothetical protein